MKKIALALVAANVLSIVASAYMGARYFTESKMAYQSFIHAQERARLAGAADAIPQMSADYIDSLREQNIYLLTIVLGGFSVVLAGNTLWIFCNLRGRRIP